MSRETALEMGATRLLLLAWHVKTVCRWRRPSFSRRRTFCTRRSGTCSYESSSNAFSCHHVTLGLGRPVITQRKHLVWVHFSYRSLCSPRFIVSKAGRSLRQLETATQLRLDFTPPQLTKTRAVKWRSVHLGNTTATATQLEGKLEA